MDVGTFDGSAGDEGTDESGVFPTEETLVESPSSLRVMSREREETLLVSESVPRISERRVKVGQVKSCSEAATGLLTYVVVA